MEKVSQTLHFREMRLIFLSERTYLEDHLSGMRATSFPPENVTKQKVTLLHDTCSRSP